MITHLQAHVSSAPGTSTASAQMDLATPVVEALLYILVHAELTDASYWLHMECMAALIVCLSTQLYCEITSDAPQPLVVAVLGCSDSVAAEVLVLRLLERYMNPMLPPKESGGLLGAISSAAGFVLLLPWQMLTFFFRSANEPPPGCRSALSRLHIPRSMRDFDKECYAAKSRMCPATPV